MSTAWMDKGNCKTSPLSPAQIGKIMFPEKAQGVVIAKMVCENCPVKERCGDYAIETGQQYGVWGGMGQRELKKERMRRKALVTTVPTTKACEVSGLSPRQATFLAKNGYLKPLGGEGKGFPFDWPLSEIVVACMFQGMTLDCLMKTIDGRQTIKALAGLIRKAPLDAPWLVVSPPRLILGVTDVAKLPKAIDQAGPLRFVLNLQEVKEKMAA